LIIKENSVQTRLTFTLLASCLTLLSASTVLAQTADPAVKKSESGICHDKSSTSYGATKKFEAFANLEACLKTGGRAPANAAAAADAVVKKSDSGICHDKNSASYEKTQKFTPFKTLDECVKSGGTLPKK
jgi:hypothetical protein